MSELELCQATQNEKAQIFAKVHEFWGGGFTVEAYVNRCLKAPHMRRATWYLGRLQGTIVTSLGAHPTIFGLDGELVEGFSIASVHTRPEDRGRGFAPRLIDFVEKAERRRGARLSVLYSDIDPAYYARLGYRRAPASGGYAATEHHDPRTRALSTPRGSIGVFDPAEQLELMSSLYEATHGRRPFYVHRPPEYATMLLAKRPRDEFFWLRAGEGETVGFARFEPGEERVKITDFALRPDHEPLRELFYRLLIAAAAERGFHRVGGWLPDLPAARACFKFGPRAKEITMAKPLDPTLELSDEVLAAADFFNEIDHV